MTTLAGTPRSRLRWLLLVAATLAACATPTLSVDDAMTFEDGSTRFVAFAMRKTGWVLQGIRDVDVQFAVDGRVVATAVTDERGFAKATTRLTREAPTFEARARIEDETFDAVGTLVSWRSDRVIVACDIDSTISSTSLSALFFDEFDDASLPIDDSAWVLNEINATHEIMYVTARPRFTLAKTRAWLEEYGYPRQPVITSLTVGDALAQTGYKTRTLKSLRKFYKNLLIGIGNTDIDADSYGAEGMLAVLVQPDARIVHAGHVVRVQNWNQLRRLFEANREALSDPEQVAAAARGELALVLPRAAPDAPAPGGGA